MRANWSALAASLFASVAVLVHAQDPQRDKPCLPVVSETINGKVISVTDGDTIKILADRQTITVRLEGIDAPEKGQDHGTKAKEALEGWIKGQDVRVGVTGHDRYGRTLGIVSLGTENINEKLVSEGWAWQYVEYNCDPRLKDLQEQAREQKLGLWAHAKPIPPWEFRRLERQRQELARQRSGVPEPSTEPTPSESKPAELKYWLNTSTNVRHNSTCKNYKNTKNGRQCGPNEGKPCGICGG